MTRSELANLAPDTWKEKRISYGQSVNLAAALAFRDGVTDEYAKERLKEWIPYFYNILVTEPCEAAKDIKAGEAKSRDVGHDDAVADLEDIQP